MIEAAGIPTVTLNIIWAYHRIVGMPRVAAIEHPFGRPYGGVGGAETQRAVLRAALHMFETAREPGQVEHLPFVWPEPPAETRWHPAEPSPIIAWIKQRAKPQWRSHASGLRARRICARQAELTPARARSKAPACPDAPM